MQRTNMARSEASSYRTSLVGYEQIGIFSSGKGALPPFAPLSLLKMIPPLFSMNGSIGGGGSGPYKAGRYFAAPDLPDHTINKCASSSLPHGYKVPVVIWGNGACTGWGGWFRKFLTEIASHGYLVISNGIPERKGMLKRTRWTDMMDAMD